MDMGQVRREGNDGRKRRAMKKKKREENEKERRIERIRNKGIRERKG